MMNFLYMNKKELKSFFDKKYKSHIEKILDYIIENSQEDELKSLKLPKDIDNKQKRYRFSKIELINLITRLFETPNFLSIFYKYLSKNSASQYIYSKLIWEGRVVDTEEVIDKFDLKLPEIRRESYGYNERVLDDELSLVKRVVRFGYRESDYLYIDRDIRDILKFLYPIPNDYNLIPRTKLADTEFSYTNEDGVLPFINTFAEMFDNKLIDFGKNNEKPLVKTLNILKHSSGINEFYRDKRLDSFATDMLTRSFYYYGKRFNFKDRELDTLKLFMEYQLKNELNFTISRIFASHLKKIRFGKYTDEEQELFVLLKYIIKIMPKDNWVGVENIIKHTYYRDLYFNFEGNYKTESYEFITDDGNILVGDNYAEIFHEPILKALFFYLGALGLLELKYNSPISRYKNIRAKGKEYISVWDSLKYIRLTELGKYIFGMSHTYTPKKIVVKKAKELKFDEFKPIITVDENASIAIAKLEPFTDKLDNNRYILSHSKIFKECKNIKHLKLKIDSFYNQIEKNPPKVFVDFFENIIKDSNQMSRNLKQVVIELKENKRLLNLFMNNRKLQELFIKAEGYRIIVLKQDIPKVTKIVKDNGFFVEF